MKLGRPREYDFEEILEIAMQLFWRKGYDNTSLNDLLDAMNISRSSFYYIFGSKYQLFELCIYRLRDRQIAKSMAELQQATNGRSFIEKLLNNIVVKPYSKDKEFIQHGFLMNIAFESSEHNPKISALISNASLRFAEIFKLAIQRGQSERVISEIKDPDELAYYFLSSIAGLRSMLKTNTDQRNIKSVVNITLTALN